MEQSIFISKVENLKHYTPHFSRLYFGNEFCEQLIPSVADLERVLDFVGENGLDFTLVSPYVTEEGLGRVEVLFQEVARRKPDSEVVFNDYGVLRVLNSRYNELEPVMGRLLNRMKRGPRLMTVISKLPLSTVEYFRSSNLTVPILGEFLNQHGVRRVELDNVLQGFDFSLDDNLTASLYVPYAYVTTTRFCLASSCDIPEREEIIGIFPCKRECQRYTFYLRSEIMPVILIREGNAIFFENEVLPGGLEERGITRIVTEPEIPM
ncbi:hypothetical protein ACFLV4_03525 [Chloroflexota bacterium]